MLEVFKNTFPSKLYWVHFPIEDLRLAVEITKRMLTKEKIDKQLVGTDIFNSIYKYER